MQIETILKIAALSIGALILLSNFVHVDSLLAKILPKKKIQPLAEVVVDGQEDFLHIINLWYQLRDNCKSYDLEVAVEKLDEVFPLLNNKIEDKTHG